MLDNTRGRLLCNYISDYVLFDIETTGLSCDADEIVELSAVKVSDGMIVDEFSTLVNPKIPIPEEASDINGITNDMVEDAPPIDEVLSDFLDFIGDTVLVGHNIRRFDMKFIYRDIEKYFSKTLGNDYIDTLCLAQAYLPDMYHHTLEDLAYYYKISYKGAHRALNDCRINQQVFECMRDNIENPTSMVGIRKCPRCGALLKLRNGKFGEFYGCICYPDCKYTENK